VLIPETTDQLDA